MSDIRRRASAGQIQTGQTTHRVTEKAGKEFKNFFKQLITLVIAQQVLFFLLREGILTANVWISLLLDVIVIVYIANTLRKWVNLEVKIFEETEWYKANKPSIPQNVNDYEITEKGKELIKNFINNAVYFFLFAYIISKLSARDIIEFNNFLLFPIIGVFILFTTFYLISQRKMIVRQKLGSSSPNQNLSSSFAQSSIASAVSSAQSSSEFSSPRSSSEFSSPGSSSTEYCKTCYGGLNAKGKCNQCDVKW